MASGAEPPSTWGGSLTAQWMRTRLPIVVLVSISIAISTAALAQTVAPRGPFLVNVPPNDRDLAILMLLAACVVLIIASTIIFTQWFLRPLLDPRQLAKASMN